MRKIDSAGERVKVSETPEEVYLKIVEHFQDNPDVSRQEGKKGFGSSALWTNGKIFAMLSVRGKIVFKLPKQRVDELVNMGRGERMETGNGRAMKEWLEVDPSSRLDFLSLGKEALDYSISSVSSAF
jgi:hypothetical protein